LLEDFPFSLGLSRVPLNILNLKRRFTNSQIRGDRGLQYPHTAQRITRKGYIKETLLRKCKAYEGLRSSSYLLNGIVTETRNEDELILVSKSRLLTYI